MADVFDLTVIGTGPGGEGAAMQAAKLDDALTIYADLLRRPHLPEDQLEDSRLVCYQELQAVEDDLAQRVFLQLRQRQYGDPWGLVYRVEGAEVYGTLYSIGDMDVSKVALTQMRQAAQYLGDGFLLDQLRFW